MYICSNCGLRVGAADAIYCDEPSHIGPCCISFFRKRDLADDFDSDELGLDPEEDYDA